MRFPQALRGVTVKWARPDQATSVDVSLTKVLAAASTGPSVQLRPSEEPVRPAAVTETVACSGLASQTVTCAVPFGARAPDAVAAGRPVATRLVWVICA